MDEPNLSPASTRRAPKDLVFEIAVIHEFHVSPRVKEWRLPPGLVLP